MAPNVQYILSLKDQFSAGIDRANASVKGLESSMMGLKGVIASTFSIVGIRMFVKSIVDAGSKVEDAQTGLTTLLGNAKDASRVIQNTMEDATKTPFAFEGLLNANKALISAGISADKARADVLNLGNAIAATGGGDAELQRMVVNLQQISNTGKATALDIKQFAYAGVNIYKVLEAAGLKANSGGKDTAITYDQITQALATAHGAGGIYFNGLENMAGNTSVKISNLGDAVFQLKVKMFNDLKPAIESVLTGMFKLVDKLKTGWEWMVKNKEVVKSFAVGMMELYVAFKVVVPLAQGFGVATSAMLGPLGLALAAIVAVNGALNVMSAAYDDARRAEADFTKQGNLADIDRYRVGYEERQKKSGLSMAEYVKREKSDIEKGLAEINSATENALRNGSQVSNNGLQDLLFKKQALESLENKGLVKNSTAAAGAATSKKGKDRAETRATGSKSVTINVSVKDLIGTYNMNVTNIKEGAQKAKDIIVNALAGALNDFQVVAE